MKTQSLSDIQVLYSTEEWLGAFASHLEALGLQEKISFCTWCEGSDRVGHADNCPRSLGLGD